MSRLEVLFGRCELAGRVGTSPTTSHSYHCVLRCATMKHEAIVSVIGGIATCHFRTDAPSRSFRKLQPDQGLGRLICNINRQQSAIVG